MLIFNEKAHFFVLGLICFLKLMDVWRAPMPIKLTNLNIPKTKNYTFSPGDANFIVLGYYKVLVL
ncbi:hypothetical protein CN912_24380 [Bacillus cereus]|nr:hypothetical protein [Bacillus cereus]PES16182.1 hypothetical protein CN501_10050 [Bacillus cereus]PGL06432.1 hypothetical protein CN912_24380 [Bacillus cereus]